MAGTFEGGKQAAMTNIMKYGEDFYREIGAKGGRNGHTGGFYGNRKLAIVAGTLGGQISRRGNKKIEPSEAARLRRRHKRLYT
jgi:general stress protein YciG